MVMSLAYIEPVESSFSVPPLMVVVPVYELAFDRVIEPAPDLVKLVEPEMIWENAKFPAPVKMTLPFQIGL